MIWRWQVVARDVNGEPMVLSKHVFRHFAEKERRYYEADPVRTQFSHLHPEGKAMWTTAIERV